MKITKCLWGGIALGLAAFAAGSVELGAAGAASESVSIPVETVADYVHAVIEADRTIYTQHIVERMQEKGIVFASEDWETRHTLPLPAQFLMDAARLIAKTDIGIRYRLVSLWPIYERNAPATDLELKGLEAVLKQPDRRYSGIVQTGQARYFQAVYADRAVSRVCIGCHNAHPKSPKRDFKMNDVMGAIVVTIPLER